jgi:RNA polymerase sigma factor (sigma-70 family)
MAAPTGLTSGPVTGDGKGRPSGQRAADSASVDYDDDAGSKKVAYQFIVVRQIRDMATNVIEQLRSVLLHEVGDGELLSWFLERHDQTALTVLVKRHGPMVWGVCRRLLSHHDAEDAFQTTFIVLVRKAASIMPRHMVGNWLYGVAHQVALQARRAATRRRAREVQVTNMPETEAVRKDQWPLLDQELSRLPDNYRTVIVLCDLEDRTRREVARQLGVPEGTVAGRLARARAMLAKRLAQKGITLSGGALAAVLSQNLASATMPMSVLSSTNAVAVGQAAISSKVAALAEGVMKAMLMSKLKAVLAVALILGFVATGATILTCRTAAGQEGKKPTAEKPMEQAAKQKPIAVSSKDLRRIEPPGGVPLPIVKPGTNEIGVDELNKVSKRLEAVPEKELERWVIELERIMDAKLKDGLPSPRQACRTDFVIHMSLAFDDLKWNAKTADNLYKRACSIPASEGKVWKNAFESLTKKEIGTKQTGQDEFSNSAGGPLWAVPLVLIPVDALHKGQKYSVERGKKYRARLKQLNKDDVALWRDKVDKFGGTELDAAVNIILLDSYFNKEEFQQDKFKADIEQQKEQK